VEGLNQQQDLEDERVPDLPSLDSAGEGIREDESDGPTGMEAEHKAVDQQPLPSVADAGAAGVDDSGKDTDDGEDEEEEELVIDPEIRDAVLRRELAKTKRKWRA